MPLSRRLWAAALLLLVFQFGAIIVQRGYAPTDVITPPYELAELPARLGEWHSERDSTDEQISEATGAAATVDRVYSKPGSPDVSIHFGRWCDPSSRAPHLPQYCYAGAGWVKQDEKPFVVSNATDPGANALLITWARESNPNDRLRSLHWYRRGEQTYSDWTVGTQVYRNLWGSRDWPAVEKVLLQTEFDDNEASRERLKEVAEEINRWTMSVR